MALQLSKLPETPADPDISSPWSNLRTAIHQAAVESVGDTKTGSTVHQVSTTYFRQNTRPLQLTSPTPNPPR